MEKRKLKILVIFLIFVFMGFNASAANAGGIICMQEDTTCDKFKIVYDDTSDPHFFSLTGYEYGCGYADRLFSGSARTDGDIAYIQFVVNFKNPYPTTRLTQFNIQYNMANGTGSGIFAVHADTYFQGTRTFSLINCSQ